jgi:two-component system sensor histidine kinase VanS
MTDRQRADAHTPPAHRSVRARFAVATAGLLVGMGGLMLALVYVLMRYVPSYDITHTTTAAATTLTPGATSLGGLTTAQGIATLKPVGVVISNEADILNAILIASVLVLLVIGALGGWLIWLMVGRMLRPLQALSTAAERAALGSFEHRVGLTGADDEFTRLSRTFDNMLERLERLFTAQQRFAANASHELRTPLATTKTMLEVGRSDPDPSTIPQLLARLAETNDRNIAIVDALLDLSDATELAIAEEVLDVAEIVEAEVASAGAAAEARGVRLDVSLRPAPTAGDRVLLSRLVANLVGNAIRHNVPTGRVHVETRWQGGSHRPVVLVVSNTGDLVPDTTIALLTEPFYRARGRTHGTGLDGRDSHGIGLTLVASIVDAHHGVLEMRPRSAGGLVVTVRLPSVAHTLTPGLTPLDATTRRAPTRTLSVPNASTPGTPSASTVV